MATTIGRSAAWLTKRRSSMLLSVCSRPAGRPTMRSTCRRSRAAGIVIDWEDFDRLSAVVPLIARIYPNGAGDVNDFQAAGGMAFTIATLLDAGLLHRDLLTVGGQSLADYAREPKLDGETLIWQEPPLTSRDGTMLRPASDPFRPDGGMRLVTGNLGRAIFKTSAVDPSRWTIEAPAR